MGNTGVAAKECRVSSPGDENALKLSVVMAAQICGYTKNHGTG